jgi:hypothetical protein
MSALLIITGAMGAGKTSVLGEASDILARRQITHSAVDVDALGLAYLPTATRNDAAMYCNLRSRARRLPPTGLLMLLHQVEKPIHDRVLGATRLQPRCGDLIADLFESGIIGEILYGSGADFSS